MKTWSGRRVAARSNQSLYVSVVERSLDGCLGLVVVRRKKEIGRRRRWKEEMATATGEEIGGVAWRGKREGKGWRWAIVRVRVLRFG